jgi:hypothetical protein
LERNAARTEKARSGLERGAATAWWRQQQRCSAVVVIPS